VERETWKGAPPARPLSPLPLNPVPLARPLNPVLLARPLDWLPRPSRPRAVAALALVLTVALAALLPIPAAAQERPRAPARLVAAVGDCLTAELGDTLTEPAYSEELAEGWRIVLALRGQPGMAATSMQSPPPPEDTVAAVDIYQILPGEPTPDFVDNMSAFLALPHFW